MLNECTNQNLQACICDAVETKLFIIISLLKLTLFLITLGLKYFLMDLAVNGQCI